MFFYLMLGLSIIFVGLRIIFFDGEGRNKESYLFIFGIVKVEVEYENLFGMVCGRFFNCKGVLEVLQGYFFFYEFMILDNINYN